MMLVAGVDEVGRGSLVGPVVTCVVVFRSTTTSVPGVKDSKKIPESRRPKLAEDVKNISVDWAIGRAEAWEIDKINIFQATMLAMARAINNLSVVPHKIFVDGLHYPDRSNFREDLREIDMEAVVDGDQNILVVSAASIIAKVTRDLEVIEYEKSYPGYGFKKNKGYGTKEHLTALYKLGATPLHRKTFKPISELI